MLSRRGFQASLLGASAAYPLFPAAAAPAGNVIHVSAAGTDKADGSGPESAVATLARATSLAEPGDTIALRRGDIWRELLHISKPFLTVRAFGEGPAPRIFGDRRRNCIWVSARDATIDGIDGDEGLSGVIIQGEGASGAVRNATFSACGTGVVAGGGGKRNWGGPGFGPPKFGQLLLAENVRCVRASIAYGAGDGIQIGEDATTGVTHRIRNSACEANGWAGVNAKSGKVIVEKCRLTANGLMGWNAHINCDEFHISECLIEGNGTAARRTAQAVIENHVRVYSSRNVYRDPHNGLQDGQYTLHIHVVPGWHAAYETRPELTCIADLFVSRLKQTPTLGSIGVYMTEKHPARVTVLQCTFDHAQNAGIAIDAYNSAKLSLTAKNNIFSMANFRALRLDPRADFRSRIDHNLYFGTAALVEIQDTASYRSSSLGRLFAEYGIEKHGIAADPLFVSPKDGDYRLRPNSHALRAGAPDLGVTKDATGRAFASPPSIGAFEA